MARSDLSPQKRSLFVPSRQHHWENDSTVAVFRLEVRPRTSADFQSTFGFLVERCSQGGSSRTLTSPLHVPLRESRWSYSPLSLFKRPCSRTTNGVLEIFSLSDLSCLVNPRDDRGDGHSRRRRTRRPPQNRFPLMCWVLLSWFFFVIVSPWMFWANFLSFTFPQAGSLRLIRGISSPPSRLTRDP